MVVSVVETDVLQFVFDSAQMNNVLAVKVVKKGI